MSAPPIVARTMQSSTARAVVSALLTVLLGACGGDDDGGDGAASPDSGPGSSDDAGAGADAGVDAGDDLCPGQLTFEALVADAETGEGVFEVDLEHVGGSDQVSSAPNGRAVLCLPGGSDAQVRSTGETLLERLDTMSADALAAAAAAARPYPVDVMDALAADTLLAALGPERDILDSLLLVSVVSYPDGQPLLGATLSIDVVDNDGAFARDAAGDFAASAQAQIGDGRLVMFANVALAGGAEAGRVSITVAPPKDFVGECAGPESVELVAGGIAGALFACQ